MRMRVYRGELWHRFAPEIAGSALLAHLATDQPTGGVEAHISGYAQIMRVRVPLPNSPRAASKAREELKRTIEQWGTSCSMDDLLLIVSELVTNAFRYGKGPVAMHLAIEDGHVLIAITDNETKKVPVPGIADDDQPTGRGLRLVTATASQWGWQKLPGRKVVWAQVPIAA
ncbi:MAG: ATP-binding protein [Actinobacteria bacterium]|nr:ATP-binding protein [Actinomycetota bacterium]